MRVSCPRCACKLGKVDPSLSGHPALCEECGGEFIIPFKDGEGLLEWVKTAPWEHVEEASRSNIGKGHSRQTVSQFINLFEKRREREIWRLERERHGEVLTGRERLWRAIERREEKQKVRAAQVEDLLSLDPVSFERFVAELFNSQGYVARAVGGTNDRGIDVEVRNSSGDLWAIAQCKRYSQEGRIRARDIRDFAGSFLMCGAEAGFFFTTGYLTKEAKKTAKQFSWLKVYEGTELLDLAEKAEETEMGNKNPD